MQNLKKPKIGILTFNMDGGGAQRFISILLHELSADFEIHLLLFENLSEYDLPDGQIVEYLDRSSGKPNLLRISTLPFIAKRLINYCENANINLVLSFLNRPNIAVCLAKLMGLKARVLISERIYTPLWFREGTLYGRIGKFLTSKFYAYADVILPNSYATLVALESEYGIKSRYIQLKNAIQTGAVLERAREPVEDVDFDKGFTFIHIGRFDDQKQHHVLVDAFAGLERGKSRLLLVGKGPLEAEIRDRCDKLGIIEEVEFVGYQKNPFKYLARADCLVLTSEFEGFPNVVLEALACGIPVISTDCYSGPRELLAPGTGFAPSVSSGFEEGEFGVLVPVNGSESLTQAMKKMMADDALRNRYVSTGPTRAADYDMDVVVPELKKIIISEMDAFGPAV